MVEVDHGAGAGDPTRVVRDQHSSVEHFHPGGLQRDADPSTDEPGRDGVLHHPHRHQRRPVDPRVQDEAGVEPIGR